MANSYTEKTAQRIADKFNELCPIGTMVEYQEVLGSDKDFPKTLHAVRAEAFIYGAARKYAVVFLDGKRGWVCVDHITGWHEPQRRFKDHANK
jgi:hypothetical protein